MPGGERGGGNPTALAGGCKWLELVMDGAEGREGSVSWTPQHPSRRGPWCPRDALSGVAVQSWVLGGMEMLPALPPLGFGSSGAIPTLSPCHTAQPDPSPRAPSWLQGRDWGGRGQMNSTKGLMVHFRAPEAQ